MNTIKLEAKKLKLPLSNIINGKRRQKTEVELQKNINVYKFKIVESYAEMSKKFVKSCKNVMNQIEINHQKKNIGAPKNVPLPPAPPPLPKGPLPPPPPPPVQGAPKLNIRKPNVSKKPVPVVQKPSMQNELRAKIGKRKTNVNRRSKIVETIGKGRKQD